MIMKLKKKRGQAVLEYVLLLTVAVLVTGALVFKLNKGLKVWAKALIGNDGYIACLMQTGKLPGQTQICRKPADVQADLTLSEEKKGEGGAETNGDEASNKEGKGGAGSSPDKSAEEGDYDSSSSAVASSSKRGRKKGRRGGRRTALPNPEGELIPQTAGEGSFGGADEDEEEGGGGGGRKKKRMGFRDDLISQGKPGYRGRRFKAVTSIGAFNQEQEENSLKQKPIAVAKGSVKKNRLTGSNKKSYLVKKRLKKKTEEVKVGKWSFGNMFRIILIICVIATVVLLIGGQVTQVKKSMK